MTVNERKGWTSRRVALAVLISLALVLGSASMAPAQGRNLVYVESDITTTNGNSVFGFSNDGSGNLTPLPNSPYLTSGTGVKFDGPNDFPFDADNQVVVNPEGTLLFAVNGHTNTVAVFSINSDGSLTAVSGSPFASHGPDPAALGFVDKAFTNGDGLLVAVNKDSDFDQVQTNPNYTTFTVPTNGQMTFNSASTLNLPAGSSPAQAMIQGGKKFFAVEFANNDVATYQLHANGSMTQISVSTPSGTTPMTLGGVLHPTVRGAYIALPIQRQIAVYEYSSTDQLTFLKTVPNQGTAVCWLAMNAAGTRLYSGETPSSTITVYDTTHPRNPTQIQRITLASINGKAAQPANLAFDTTGNFLYAVDRDGALHVLSVDSNGNLSEPIAPTILNVPEPGTIPLGVAVTQ